MRYREGSDSGKRRTVRVRRAALVGAVLGALLAAAACTGGGPDGGGPDGPPSALTDGVDDSLPLLVATGRDVTPRGGVRQRLVDAWNRQPGHRKARLVPLPGSADEQRSQIMGALQSGSAHYDAVNLDVTWVPEFAEAGLIRPFSAADAKKYVDNGDVIGPVAETARWDGQVYAVPFNSDVGLLYYRSDFLRAANQDLGPVGRAENGGASTGDPERRLGRAEQRRLAERVERAADADTAPDLEQHWTTQLDDYEGLTVNAIEAFASARDDFAVTDEQGRYIADRQQLEDGVEEFTARTAHVLGSAHDSHEAESLEDFVKGRTTFLRHWPYAYGALHQSLKPDQVGVTRLPGRAVLGGQNLAVVSRTTDERAAEARELIEFLTGPESERCLLEAGFAATRESAYREGTACRSGDGGPQASATGGPSAPPGESIDRMPRDASGRPRYAMTLLAALEDAVLRPRTPFYGAFTQVVTTELRKLHTDKSPPSSAEVAAALDEELARVLPGPE
ncbi:extracellular solute-binding protein [Streptomyces sp. NPDC002851]